ncbi:cyclomaltodextrin glucanotransferase [Lysobacter niastensis]|uniref:Cyclomaltodextrin glucanotransferase n=2 Tax=Lysobacter niastensis TaxID=380629 RepID=A0ABS0BDW2_9GAMM|nr:alpha-amylase family glycosyl hydrolase [Lysobacter niastensis]MBF6025305.1 cyclomaltodextrin glucanotransferase [Lysobacter niastensis]
MRSNMARAIRVSLASVPLLVATTAQAATPDIYGTLEPFASEAVYFVVTDRFVNGDTSNDQREQGGADPARRTFDRRIPGPNGESDNIGYLGGDFKGVLDNAGYIRGMGFTSVWVTPIVDQPDEAFTGGKPASWGSFWTDQGKTGYHGYWGVNFYKLDEHLPSPGLDFGGFTKAMQGQGLKVVLDIVGNHGSPSFTMPVDQPKFGEVYDANGALLADHQNLPPDQLDPQHNPLHAFFHTTPEIAELSNFDDTNPAVMDYLAGAYAQWLDQGAAALRIDTIGWMPHAFWKEFARRMRERRPGLFMFGENFDYHPDKIAPHTWAENGGISVLDFPLKERMGEVFGRGKDGKQAGYERLEGRLYLRGGPYANPYDLMTFYDNHDMPRLDASDAGFIDAHNWLFTARGIPVVYYGSEVGFMRGRAEHAGNRNYFGQERVDGAAGNPIHDSLARIAKVRAASPALQRGVQLDVLMKGDRAAFYRVYQHDGVAQTALVLLNKGDAPAAFEVKRWLQAGQWRAALGGGEIAVGEKGRLDATVPAHGVEVYLLDAPVTRADLLRESSKSMAAGRGR